MHEYLRRIFLARERGNLSSGFNDIQVAHDDRCGIYDFDECDCNPEITVTTEGAKYKILPDGSVAGKH